MISGIAAQTVGIWGISGKWAAASDRHLRRVSLNGLIRKIISVTNTHYRKRKRVPAVLKSPRCIKATLQARLNKTISSDGTTLQDALESLYLRLNVTLASQHTIVKGKTVQLPYSPGEIFTLEKWGAEYRMVNTIEGVTSCTDGYYVFIIPADAPYKIQCAALACPEEPISRLPLKGHSSFVNVTNNVTTVHFAGVLKFAQQQLAFWSNASGHFMPPAETRHALLPYIKLLLPESHFVDHRFLLAGCSKTDGTKTGSAAAPV
ncbi:hypothetical protein [Candidatus Symbiopectobacterium sp. NZEC135]|uniref:hypothetical protein n=1 Tax=Candidatus Symbiopectobacterium sp. NZEC135 TaxID=2820471 RepID=UPI0022267598|nr:hypothetical protein [Candidatus Symbiopectobacterium sp. NZEC135]MCW2478690.1 hypothetical protein [Candidatus Symbiopectobacterium sp. NZEC135]